MRQLATMLIPPLAILVAVAITGSGRIDTPHTPVPECLPAPEPRLTAETPLVSPPEMPDPVGAAPDLTAPSADGGNPDTAAARALLFSLRFAVESSAATFPTLEVAEAARLLTRRPETADVFIGALDGASRELRTILLHTFYRVEDTVLRQHLLKVHRETDPTAARLRRILADRTLILAALQNHTDEGLLPDLLGRVGSPLLADPEIRAAMLGLAREAEDPNIRRRALARIGRIDDPEVRELLLTTLADPQRDLGERQTAARVLMRRPGPDTTPLFVDIINRNEAASLLRFSALGLKTVGDEPAATEALFALLLEETADETARKNAATALSHTARTAPEGSVLPLERRLRSALTDLSQQKSSDAVLAHAMGEMSRGLDGRFDAYVVGILRSRESEQVRALLVAAPTLERFMGER